MKVKKINKFDIKVPNKKAFTIETEFDYLKKHCNIAVSGVRGSGKTIATVNYIRHCRDKHYFDRVYLITPTYISNKKIWDIASIEEDDVIEPTVNSINTILSRVEQEKQDWDEYLEKKKRYKLFTKDMKHKNIHAIETNAMLYYYEMGFLDGKPPEWKYPKEQPPRLALIIDDCLGTDLMAKRSAGLLNLVIKHRHIADGLGISIFMLIQSYCAQGGLARPIRENLTALMLFKINDENQLKKIKEEADLPITEDEFNQMCEVAFSIDFNFLLIDFNPKCKKRKFRSGFDNYIIPKSLEKVKCDCEKCVLKIKI